MMLVIMLTLKTGNLPVPLVLKQRGVIVSLMILPIKKSYKDLRVQNLPSEHIPVVLSFALSPHRDLWQCLETFVAVTARERDSTWWVEAGEVARRQAQGWKTLHTCRGFQGGPRGHLPVFGWIPSRARGQRADFRRPGTCAGWSRVPGRRRGRGGRPPLDARGTEEEVPPASASAGGPLPSPGCRVAALQRPPQPARAPSSTLHSRGR